MKIEGMVAAKEETVSAVDDILEKVEVTGLSILGGPAEMKRRLAENLAIHQAVIDFVNERFVHGIDYGRAIENQSAKPVLLLPGAEKIVRAFDTHQEYANDVATWTMLGKPTNTVFIICRIVDNKTGKVIGEGRGACTIGEKFGLQAARDTNGSIKIAEKRALVDAAKGTFMLSDRFTQDLEEIKSFIDVKRSFFESVQKMRAGIKSELTDNAFVRIVCEGAIHKKVINTRKELDLVMAEVSNYDFATGERLES